MKKITKQYFILTAFIFTSFFSNAQTILNGDPIYFLGNPSSPGYTIQSGAWNDGMKYKHYTSHQFLVNGSEKLRIDQSGLNVKGNPIYFLGDASDPGYLIQSGAWNDGMKYKHYTSHQFLVNGNEKLRIDNGGLTLNAGGAKKAVIGSNGDGFFSGKLQVDGTILTTRVKVAAFGGNWNWADYVFAKEYQLKPLQQVEAYIKANQHLEGIPTTAEIHRDGLDVAPVTAKLLEKIEEITLYMIEMKKENETMKIQNDSQQTAIENLKKELYNLKK